MIIRRYTSIIRFLELKALFIALACHFLFAGFILFKITPRDRSVQPALVFLGSLLVENDFHNLTSQRSASKAEETTSPIKTKAYPHPLGSLQEVSKPGFSEKKDPHQKTFIKSTFISPEDIDPSVNVDTSTLGVNPMTPERAPLKLDEK